MKFDKNALKKLDNKEANKILIKDGLIFYIIGSLLLLFAIFALIGGAGSLSLLLFVPAIVLFALGFKNLLIKGENRERYLTSKLVAIAIKEEKKNGKSLSKEEIDRIKFEYDPIFHDNVIAQVHREQDNAYYSKVRNSEKKLKDLENARINEIKKISNERWQNVGNGNLKYNLTEGKISINQTEHLFTSIKSAEVNKENSYRVVTTNTGSSRKKVSVGKALVGGVLLGRVGAVIGGSQGKTVSTGQSTSNSIPTCNHIGVLVDINGFKTEVILLNNTVDKSSNTYKNALKNAGEMVSKLHFLASQPVPKSFTKVEDEKSVLEFGKQIAKAQDELEKTKTDKPTYDIPEKYVTTKKENNIKK